MITLKHITYVYLIVGTALTMTSCAADPMPTENDAQPLSYSIEQITMESEWEDGDFRYEFYANKAYTCAFENYHTFLIAYGKEVSTSEPHPLWLRMHGGASGAFDEKGRWVPSNRGCAEKPNPDLEPGEMPRPCFQYGESPDYLAFWLDETGLVAKAKAVGFRFLVPSACDHDLYGGAGEIDKYNPHNPDENGNPRRVDGLLAVRAALEFTRHKLATTHIIAHGTSAGSFGAFSLVSALGSEGRRISGAILDSSVMSPYLPQLAEEGCLKHTQEHLNYYMNRGAYWQEENMGHVAIPDGRVLTPLYDFWSRRDPVCDCTGVGMVTVEDKNGNEVTDTGCNIQHDLFDEALLKYNPGGASRVHRVCIDDARKPGDPGFRGLRQWPCSLHTPTKFDARENGGDQDRAGEDYNQIIFDWVLERLQEVPPRS